jgi:hypothetical protein
MTTPRKKARIHEEDTATKFTEEERCNQTIAYVKSQRPYRLTLADRINILQLQAVLRLQNSESPPVLTAQLLGRAQKTVKEVWREFVETGKLSEKTRATTPPPTRSRTRRITSNPALLADLRSFIRARAAARQRTVAKDVLSFFVTKSYLTVQASERREQADESLSRHVQPRLLREVDGKAARCFDKRGMKNCVLVMGNAKYHKALPGDVPKKRTPRQS